MTGITATHPFASGGGGLASIPRASKLFLVSGGAAVAVYPFLPSDAQSIVYVLIGLAAVCAMYAGARLRPKAERLTWYLFAAGFLCEIAGDAVFALYEVRLDREPPLPSVADVFYLAGYPLIVLAIVLLLRELGGHTSRVALLDTAIVAVAIATVQWIFLVGAQLDGSVSLSARAVNMAYPSMDLLLLIALVQLILGPARRSSGYWLLLVSVALWAAADEIYLALGDNHPRAWLDCIWLASYVVWGAAALDISTRNATLRDRRAVPRLTMPRIVMLGAALLAVPVAASIEAVQGNHVHVWVEAAGASVIAILVLVRLSGLVRAVEAARADERAARKAAEAMQLQLAEQNERLVELDQLKDEFVSMVSHELRTPLSAVTGYVELLLEDETDEQAHRYLEIAKRNAERLRDLVDDLLFAARLQVGGLVELERGPVDLALLAREAVETAAPGADAAGVELRLSADAELPVIDGDADRLARLLANLVSNAIKFTPGGGRVEIALRADGGSVLLEVSDTGTGIPEDERAKLFERFFRSQAVLDRRVPGSGLGLYICKAIVDAHGGRIAIRSVVDRGTVVLVMLPAPVAVPLETELPAAEPVDAELAASHQLGRR
jgi:signal transduction histidine kinase